MAASPKTLPAVRPLQGATVLDLSRMLPGAVAARMLADLGARVIKVEEPMIGDPMRAAPPRIHGIGAAFCAFFRGTESICLNLKQPRDATTLSRLVRHADVLFESFRPGTLEAWGIGPEKLLALHPELVACSLSAFGSSGPQAGRAGHDLDLAAWSGLLSFLPGREVPGVQVADVAAGMLAGCSALAALLGRQKTGRGGWIDQPLVGGPLPFMTLAMAEAAAGGGGVAGRLLSGNCPAYRLYTCREGSCLALGAIEPKFWTGFVEMLGLPELAQDGHDDGPAGREAARQVESKLAEHPRDHWLARAAERGLPIAPVRDAETALADLRDAGLIEQTPVPGRRTLPLPGPYLRSLGVTPERPAPRLGQHTESILKEFGLG